MEGSADFAGADRAGPVRTGAVDVAAVVTEVAGGRRRPICARLMKRRIA